jgi:hypothetical protein
MESVFFSRVSYNIGQRIIKRMGLWAAARYLRNQGISLDDAIDYLTTVPEFVAAARRYNEHRKTNGKCISTEVIEATRG